MPRGRPAVTMMRLNSPSRSNTWTRRLLLSATYRLVLVDHRSRSGTGRPSAPRSADVTMAAVPTLRLNLPSGSKISSRWPLRISVTYIVPSGAECERDRRPLHAIRLELRQLVLGQLGIEVPQVLARRSCTCGSSGFAGR